MRRLDNRGEGCKAERRWRRASSDDRRKAETRAQRSSRRPGDHPLSSWSTCAAVRSGIIRSGARRRDRRRLGLEFGAETQDAAKGEKRGRQALGEVERTPLRPPANDAVTVTVGQTRSFLDTLARFLGACGSMLSEIRRDEGDEPRPPALTKSRLELTSLIFDGSRSQTWPGKRGADHRPLTVADDHRWHPWWGFLLGLSAGLATFFVAGLRGPRGGSGDRVPRLDHRGDRDAGPPAEIVKVCPRRTPPTTRANERQPHR